MTMQSRSGRCAPMLVCSQLPGAAEPSALPTPGLACLRTRAAVRKGRALRGADAPPGGRRLQPRALRPAPGAVAAARRRRDSGRWRWLHGSVAFDDAGIRGVAGSAGWGLLCPRLWGAGWADCGAFDAECPEDFLVRRRILKRILKTRTSAGKAGSADVCAMPQDQDAAGCEGDRQGEAPGWDWARAISAAEDTRSAIARAGVLEAGWVR
jgi:hypothetical protein